MSPTRCEEVVWSTLAEPLTRVRLHTLGGRPVSQGSVKAPFAPGAILPTHGSLNTLGIWGLERLVRDLLFNIFKATLHKYYTTALPT